MALIHGRSALSETKPVAVIEQGIVRMVASGELSSDNTSTTALGSGETFTGEWEQNADSDVIVSCQTDNSGTLFFDFSNDGTNSNTFPIEGFVVEPGIHSFHSAVKGPRYFRVRLVNDTGAQSYLRLYTYYGTFRQPNLPVNSAIGFDADATVTRSTSELEVMTRKVDGQYIIPKFGRNDDVDAAEDIWDGGGTYTGFPTATAENFEVLSSDANDANGDTGARQIRIWYLDDNYEMFDANGDFLTVDVTLNGTTPVDSGVSGMRVWRAKVISSGSSQTNEGNITVRWATTEATVFTVILAGTGQSETTNFTVPLGYRGYLKRYIASMNDNTANSADMAIKVREFGTNTFRLIRPFLVTTTKDFAVTLYGGEEFQPRTDLVFRCTGITNANGDITVSYGIHLVKQ